MVSNIADRHGKSAREKIEKNDVVNMRCVNVCVCVSVRFVTSKE